MTINEFENIKSNIGCLISTNGFLSTSTNIHLAKEFIDGVIDSENFKVVIFEIIVDGSNLENTIFVDIDQYTKLTSENEILFNIGSIFKIENVDYDVNMKVWIIKMKATDEGTHEIKASIDAKKHEFHQENINLMFGRLLLDMNEYTKAESYFQMMLRILPKSHEDLPLIYDHIGDLNMKTTNWNAALINFNLAYEIKKKILPINHPLLGTTFNNLGNYYKAIGDYMKALEYYKKALQCQNDRFNMARIQLNIDTIYGITNDHNKALSLCIESRDLLQQIHPCSYNEIIQYQCLIGNIYLNQKNYQIAIDYYLAGFEMSKQILLINDRLRIDCIKYLVELYYHRNMKQLAIDFCLEQLFFYEKYLHENHLNIAYLTMKIGELYDDDERKILFLQKALRMFEKSVQIEYTTTENCLMMIAEYYQKQNLYQRALKYYIRALEIRKKIYPKDHSIVIETQSIIDTKILSKEL